MKSEKIKAIFRININLSAGINNKMNEPIKGNKIKVNNIFYFFRKTASTTTRKNQIAPTALKYEPKLAIEFQPL